MNEQEKWWNSARQSYIDVPIPEQLNEEIDKGIMRAVQSSRKKKRTVWSTMAAGIMLLIFVSMIRYSPAFAAAVSEIPGMSGFVKLISYDSGLTAAVDNNMVQEINRSDTHAGITLTVNGIIADEKRLVILYTLSGDQEKLAKFHLSDARIVQAGGGQLYYSAFFGDYPAENNQRGKANQGQIDFNFRNNQTPESVVFHAHIDDGVNAYPFEWNIPISIDWNRFKGMERTIVLHQTITVSGQSIELQSLKIYPTTNRLTVKFAPTNTMHIFGFRNLQIVSDTGKSLTTHWNTFSEDQQTIYFESSYFSKAKHWYLKFDGIYALDKDKMNVILDLNHKKLVQAPDSKLTLQSITPVNDAWEISLLLHVSENYWGGNILNTTFTDDSGKLYATSPNGNFNQASYWTTSSQDGKAQIQSFHIPKKQYTGNLIFDIQQYPNTIGAPTTIQLK